MQTMASVPPGEKVILVGHSFGGFSVSLAMEKFHDKILAGVFATAVMLCVEKPDSVISKVYFANRRNVLMDCKIKEKQDSPHQLSSIEFSPSYMTNKLYQNCPIEDLELAKMLVRPATQFEHDEIYEKMISREKYGTVPRVYVVCRDDRISSEQFQKWIIEQSPGTEAIEIPGADHMVMLSKPKELFDVLHEIANKYN